jgi:hypothetical protein
MKSKPKVYFFEVVELESLIEVYESKVIPAFDSILSQHEDCVKIQKDIQRLLDSKEWYLQQRDFILDTFDKLDLCH